MFPKRHVALGEFLVVVILYYLRYSQGDAVPGNQLSALHEEIFLRAFHRWSVRETLHQLQVARRLIRLGLQRRKAVLLAHILSEPLLFYSLLLLFEHVLRIFVPRPNFEAVIQHGPYPRVVLLDHSRLHGERYALQVLYAEAGVLEDMAKQHNSVLGRVFKKSPRREAHHLVLLAELGQPVSECR